MREGHISNALVREQPASFDFTKLLEEMPYVSDLDLPGQLPYEDTSAILIAAPVLCCASRGLGSPPDSPTASRGPSSVIIWRCCPPCSQNVLPTVHTAIIQSIPDVFSRIDTSKAHAANATSFLDAAFKYLSFTGHLFHQGLQLSVCALSGQAADQEAASRMAGGFSVLLAICRRTC
jgi:hypothetical protein